MVGPLYIPITFEEYKMNQLALGWHEMCNSNWK